MEMDEKKAKAKRESSEIFWAASSDDWRFISQKDHKLRQRKGEEIEAKTPIRLRDVIALDHFRFPTVGVKIP